MSDTTQRDRIIEIIEHIRHSELKRGTVVRHETTLATCPADMDQIERHVNALMDQVAALDGRLLPEIPDYVKRITITTFDLDVQFFTDAAPNDNGQIWDDANDDNQAVIFAIKSIVSDIPRLDEWCEWDCYPEANGWIVFAGNDGETGHSQGEGPTIPAAIRNALDDAR